MNNFYLKTALIFCGALLCISLYYILFSIAIGGDYRLYVNGGDFVNMASFAFVLTFFGVSFFWLNIGKKRLIFLLPPTFLATIMLLVISINRYLAVYPESNAFRLYFYVGILDFLTAIILPIGLGFVVAHIYKKQKHD